MVLHDDHHGVRRLRHRGLLSTGRRRRRGTARRRLPVTAEVADELAGLLATGPEPPQPASPSKTTAAIRLTAPIWPRDAEPGRRPRAGPACLFQLSRSIRSLPHSFALRAWP